jgi:peptidoglycan/LPS O-acetylase OafA/YrhL
VVVWYVAREEDLLTPLLRSYPLVVLGNCAYGMYLFQAPVW